jgi:hypothetical protein
MESTHCALAILHYKVSEGKRKNSENSNISPCKNIIFIKKKSSRKETKNPSRYYYNSIIINLKFQHKPKNITFQKSSYKNRPILLSRGQIPLSYYNTL